VSETTAGKTADRETDVKLTKLDRADNEHMARLSEGIRRTSREIRLLPKLFRAKMTVATGLA